MDSPRGAAYPRGVITDHRRTIRERYLSAPVMAAPEPWRKLLDRPVGGLLGIGFAVHPDTGQDLVMTVSTAGHGLFDAATGEIVARDRDPDPDTSTPDAEPDLACPGLGPVEGVPVRIAGLFGGGPHRTTADGWTLDVVAPDWPDHRVILSADGGGHRGEPGGSWWHIHHVSWSEFRTAGFSPSGRTLAVATSSDLTLWTRESVPALS
ncbi:hypothetical protein ACPCKW_26195 [Streptomyces griseoincarnatus]